MTYRTDSLDAPPERVGSGPNKNAVAAIAGAAKRHGCIHALALGTLVLAIGIGSRTGNHPDFGVLRSYGLYIVVALWIGACTFGVFKILWLAVVVHDPAPSRAFFNAFLRFFSDTDRLANSVNAIVAFMIFVSGFSVLKGAIGILSPFSWDDALHRADKALHFGQSPHEWLSGIVHSPGAVFAFNLAYNVWFVALLAVVFSAAVARKDSVLRHQFFLTFMSVWLVGGFFIAIAFSSAGPCFFERAGFGTAYQPLMSLLDEADGSYSIWALSTQDMLWAGFTGDGAGSIGISAFPSMHVASAVIFALYATRRSALAGTVMWCFAGVIMVGSVVLGWHYAIDGYAGAFIAVVAWKAIGRAEWLLPATRRSTDLEPISDHRRP